MSKTKLSIWAILLVILPITLFAQQSQRTYFSGDGGRDLSIAVLEPTGKGLGENEKWMLSLIQGSINGDFQKYSAMTIIDRQNVEKIMEDQFKVLSTGYYSDTDYVSIGHMTNASYILTGIVTKTANTYMLELAVTDAESGERKATYSPKSVSASSIEDLSAVKQASADLLSQLGILLTDSGREELLRPLAINRIQAETALAQGITAQRQGTEVTALNYFYMAQNLDPAVVEASSRSSVIAQTISSGNIGADTRNDIVWRKQWIEKLTEFEYLLDKIMYDIEHGDPPYILYYSPDIKRGEINYQNETIDLSIETYMPANMEMLNPTMKALNKVYVELRSGLNATGRRMAWGLGNGDHSDSWPLKLVTTEKSLFYKFFNQQVNVVFEIVNEHNKVIGRATDQRERTISFGSSNAKDSPILLLFYVGSSLLWDSKDATDYVYSRFPIAEVPFKSVKADDITDKITIRLVSINGTEPERAKFPIWSQPKYQWRPTPIEQNITRTRKA